MAKLPALVAILNSHENADELRGEPEKAQADRGDLRLAEDHRRLAPDQIPRPRPGAHGLHLRPRRLQPRPLTEAHGKKRVIEPTTRPPLGNEAHSHLRLSHSDTQRPETAGDRLRGYPKTPHPGRTFGSPTPISVAC